MTKEEYIKKLDIEILLLKLQEKRRKEIENENKMRKCFVVHKNIVSA